MLGHRPLKLQDYLDIAKRRGWLIAIPSILFPIAGLISTHFIAPKYLSQTLVLVEQQKVPDDYVKPVITSDLDDRLASMKEQILSRSRLQPIIERFNLYAGSQMDDRVNAARKSIDIKPIHSEIAHSGGLPGFYITFKARDPRTAQAVCGEITSLFVNENLRDREQSAVGTTDFLKGQLADAKRKLDEQDARLAEFQRKYIGKLPDQQAPNVNMLTSLNTQLEAITQQLSRMEQDKTYAESMLAQQLREVPTGGPSGTSLSAQQTELETLTAQEADLANRYTPDYPDLKAVRRKLADLRAQMSKAPAPRPATSAPVTAHAESIGMQQLRAQIRAAEQGIASKRREQAAIQQEIRMYQDRIQATPLVEEEYKEITRDNQSAQQFYDTLLTKMNQSKMATDLERRQQGEQFRVMDEPNLPDSPVFPKPLYFGAAGFALGFLLGVGIVAWLEFKDRSLRTEDDIWQITKLPTLAVVSLAQTVTSSRDNNLIRGGTEAAAGVRG